MIATHKSIMIESTNDTVWDIFIDIDHWAQWNKQVEFSVLKSTLKKGAVFRWKSAGFDYLSKINTYVPKSFIGWHAKTSISHAKHIWLFEPHVNNTVVKTHEQLSGWLFFFLKPFIYKKIDLMLEQWLFNLKQKCECSEKGKRENAAMSYTQDIVSHVSGKNGSCSNKNRLTVKPITATKVLADN